MNALGRPMRMPTPIRSRFRFIPVSSWSDPNVLRTARAFVSGHSLDGQLHCGAHPCLGVRAMRRLSIEAAARSAEEDIAPLDSRLPPNDVGTHGPGDLVRVRLFCTVRRV